MAASKCVLWAFPRRNLERMQRDDPQLAMEMLRKALFQSVKVNEMEQSGRMAAQRLSGKGNQLRESRVAHNQMREARIATQPSLDSESLASVGTGTDADASDAVVGVSSSTEGGGAKPGSRKRKVRKRRDRRSPHKAIEHEGNARRANSTFDIMSLDSSTLNMHLGAYVCMSQSMVG